MQNLKKYLQIILKLKDKELMHYASSLSFHTLLSIIPILLISLSIFTHLPSFDKYYDKIKVFIFSSLLPSHQDIFSEYIEKFLSNTVGMGVFGFVVVLFTSMMFFMDYEFILNKILKAKPRSFWQSLSSYWTLISLAPLALGVSFYVSGIIQNFLNSYEYTSWINFLSFLPYLIIWGMFYATYMISTSAELKTKFVALASFVASLIWYMFKTLFVYYVIYNKTYLSIYGSFSVLLFFIIWIYASWIIFLYGVKLTALLHEIKKDNLNKDINLEN